MHTTHFCPCNNESWYTHTCFSTWQRCIDDKLSDMINEDTYVVFTLTHRYNAVRGHRTRSNNSGAEDYLRRKTNKKQIHSNWNKSYTSDENQEARSAYVRIKIHNVIWHHMLDESQQKAKPRRQHSTHKKKTGWKQTMPKLKSKKGRKRRKNKGKSTSTTQERQHARGIRILQAHKDRGGGVAPRRNNRITESATKESREANIAYFIP